MADYATFGRYLRQQRELRGLSVDEIARSTKIPPTLVGALEAGHAERLPERVFVLNYIRSYAAAVGLSPDETVTRFEALPGAPRAEAFDPGALEHDRRQRALTVLWLVLAAVALLGAGFTGQALYALAQRFATR